MEDFRTLREPWNALVDSSVDGALYARHEWYEQWIEAHHVQDSLAIVTLWRDDRMVGAAPLLRTEFRFRGIRARGLAFLWSAVAPRCNFLLADPEEFDILLDALRRTPAWDVFVAENLDAASPVTARFLSALSRERIAHQVLDSFQSPYRVLESGFDVFWEGLDRERRRYLQKKCINRLERQEGVVFSRIRSLAEFDAFVPEMYELSARSWKAKRGTPLFEDSPDARLLVGFAQIGLERGWVRVEALRVEGRLVAFEYMLADGGRYVVSRSDYDDDYRYFTPGNSLRLRILRSLLDDPAASEYDLGGADAPYKREWCNALRSHVTVTVGQPTLRGRLILTTKNTLLPWLRRLRGVEETNAEVSE